MSHHIARICHITLPAYVTCPHMSHARICHMSAYVTSPAYIMCPQMSHQPFGWKMLVTFQFTVRYKWSERKAPVPCTRFKIHYSFSMQKQKNDTNEVSVHVGVRVQYIYFSSPPLPVFLISPSSLFNYNMTCQPCCQHFYHFQFNFKFICKVLNYSSPFKLILQLTDANF